MRKPRQQGSSSIEPEAEARGPARGLSRKSSREASSNLVGGRRIRCAIYTRKSSEEGLEQEFNSLDAQREACEAFVRSQRHEGWIILPHLYYDAGYSGGTMERPALKRLLADIAAHRIDAVVVYKVDRLTRSLADLSSRRSSTANIPSISLRTSSWPTPVFRSTGALNARRSDLPDRVRPLQSPLLSERHGVGAGGHAVRDGRTTKNRL